MTQQLDISSLVTLSNGVKMPLLGLGTYKAIQSVGQAIQYAWDAGYRHIDTAAMYQNESEIGNALKQLNIPRDQIFVTTKMWYTEHGYESAKKAFETSLKKFGLDYVDLYLVHWPGLVNDTENNAKVRNETWRAFEELYKNGKARAIGVSNYTVKHLEEMVHGQYQVEILPMVNQIELHPKLSQKKLIEYCKKHNIIVEGYSPFAKGKIINNEQLKEMAAKYKKTVAQLLVRWIVQQGIVCIPKSDHKTRIEENANIYDFEISSDDLKKIDAMNEDWHCSRDPADAL